MGGNYTIEQRESDKAKVIKGPVHSEYLGELKEAIIESLPTTDKVVIHVTELAHLTSAFNQLLCSACRTLRNERKSISVEGNNLEPIYELANAIESPQTSYFCTDDGQCLLQCGTPNEDDPGKR